MTDAVPPLPIRLSADARKLEILLPVDALPTPTDVLLAQIKAECARLGIHGDLTARELEERMRSCVYGAWLTVMEAVPPVPPLDGRVELLLPVTAASGRRRVHTGDC